MTRSDEMTLDWRDKGLWLPEAPVGVDDLRGLSVFHGPFTWPLMVARDSALRHNIDTVARYFAERGVRHAPHGKTTMAPSLFEAQLAAGAWGLTAATAHQALVYARLGVPRALLANELLDVRPLRWLAAREGLEFLCYVDSPEGVAVAAEAAGGDNRVRVLVELGFPGGRTGCRTVAEVVEIASTAAATGRVEVAGVAGYEGMLPDVDAIGAYLADLRAAATAVADIVAGTPVVTAGGSSYVDLVIDELQGDWDLVVRSGAYVAHDHGHYAESSRLAPMLRPALEVWAQVLSAPEPGLVLVGMGKRDVPNDLGFPVPLDIDATVVGLNDQHAYLRASGPRPGDLLRFGISHPCTAFDRWRVIPVIDDDDRVVDVIRTIF
jgi:D-serine deaminase-like pyridoxal phosphate-dependent protein